MTDEPFLTTEEVMEYLHINLRTIYRLIHAKKIPAFRVGRQWRFYRKEIDAWLESNRSRAHAEPAARPRILVVDDEAAVRELLAKQLASADYDVDTAPDGPSAIEHLKEHECDLLVTDLRMPGMDGLSVIRESRRQRAGLPVIILTAYPSEANAIEALNLGVNSYLTKPFRMHRVLEAAARALGEPEPRVSA